MTAILEGDLSFARMPALLPQADALLASLPLNLERVSRTDSAGLAFLLELTRRARARGLELRISNAPAQITDLARFFGLDAILQFDGHTGEPG